MSRQRTAPRSPSRAPIAKRARRIIRNYLRIATLYNTPDLAPAERAALAPDLDRLNVALATIPGFSVEEND